MRIAVVIIAGSPVVRTAKVIRIGAWKRGITYGRYAVGLISSRSLLTSRVLSAFNLAASRVIPTISTRPPSAHSLEKLKRRPTGLTSGKYLQIGRAHV